MIRIILVRHGQTAWNVGAGEERFRGRIDLPLDDTGCAQALAVARRLKYESISALYASPLLRAQQTFEPLARDLGLPIHAHPGLLDINYGRFQGMTHTEAADAYPHHYARWQHTPSQVQFPGGESLGDVQARLLTMLEELVDRHAEQIVALAGHQIVNKVLACTLLGLDLDQIGQIQQDTGAFDTFQKTKDDWLTLCLNDACHLPDSISASLDGLASSQVRPQQLGAMGSLHR